MIHEERITQLSDAPTRDGSCVLYWMQASQRAGCNHALEHAVRRANELGLPVVVAFGLTDDFPEANARHYAFMVQGLAETERALRERGIRLVIRRGHPPDVARQLSHDAALVVTDRGYLRVQRQWRQEVAAGAPCQVTQVESDAVVPIGVTSDKEEYAARTIRPKIHRHLHAYLRPLEETKLGRDSLALDLGDGLDADPEGLLMEIGTDRSLPPVLEFIGGASHARRRLREFVDAKLADYDTLRNEPALDHVSHLSPYLHFGQISPLEIALAVRQYSGSGMDAFLEELVVRRELSINFVYHNPNYDTYEGLPDWAKRTLGEHADDAREVTYALEELESAGTHDAYWNAAQHEMVFRGKMHNHMRMYWGKKIIEWSPAPEEAFRRAVYLNNKYEIDGRDPNSFTGVAWCFGKHDRPWKERPIFGKVRYMNAAGLERKFDMDAYVARVNALVDGTV